METRVRDLELILIAIGGDLLAHVDGEGHLVVGTAERLREHANAPVKRRVVFKDVYSEWPDQYPLVGLRRGIRVRQHGRDVRSRTAE